MIHLFQDGSHEIVPTSVVSGIAPLPLIAFYESKLIVTRRPKQSE